jgi:hypothetical protein
MSGERKEEVCNILAYWSTPPKIRLIAGGPIKVWSQSGWQEKGS